jgi:hypothetical protein
MHENLADRGWSRLAAGLVAVVMASALAVASPAATASGANATKLTASTISGRPHRTKPELESKKILPEGVHDKIATLIIARQK